MRPAATLQPYCNPRGACWVAALSQSRRGFPGVATYATLFYFYVGREKRRVRKNAKGTIGKKGCRRLQGCSDSQNLTSWVAHLAPRRTKALFCPAFPYASPACARAYTDGGFSGPVRARIACARTHAYTKRGDFVSSTRPRCARVYASATFRNISYTPTPARPRVYIGAPLFVAKGYASRLRIEKGIRRGKDH